MSSHKKRSRLYLGMGLVVLALCSGRGLHAETSKAQDQLESIGSLSAAHIYTSYGYIGVTADAFVEKAFTAQTVTELMTEVVNMIEINIKSLRKVQDNVSKDDGEFIDAMINVYELVNLQAKALIKYVETEKPQDAEAFEKARTAAWPKLKVLLGIE